MRVPYMTSEEIEKNLIEGKRKRAEEKRKAEKKKLSKKMSPRLQ